MVWPWWGGARRRCRPLSWDSDELVGTLDGRVNGEVARVCKREAQRVEHSIYRGMRPRWLIWLCTVWLRGERRSSAIVDAVFTSQQHGKSITGHRHLTESKQAGGLLCGQLGKSGASEQQRSSAEAGSCVAARQAPRGRPYPRSDHKHGEEMSVAHMLQPCPNPSAKAHWRRAPPSPENIFNY